MTRRPPRATRTDTLFPYTPLFRSKLFLKVEGQPFGTPHDHQLPTRYDRAESSFMHVHPFGRPLVAAYFGGRSEEHTSELQSLLRISYAVFCLNKKIRTD